MLIVFNDCERNSSYLRDEDWFALFVISFRLSLNPLNRISSSISSTSARSNWSVYAYLDAYTRMQNCFALLFIIYSRYILFCKMTCTSCNFVAEFCDSVVYDERKDSALITGTRSCKCRAHEDAIDASGCTREWPSVRRMTFKSNPTSTRNLHIGVYA